MPDGGTNPPTADRSSAQVRGWKVFGVGTHKQEYYGPPRIRQIAANFRELAGLLTPTVKVGHDRSQRLLKSLGFPNAGRVAGVTVTPESDLTLDLDGIPPEVAGEINAGRLNSGSIELKGAVRDPRDQGRVLPGDVLVAVALLGEEQPAVPGFAPPRAVYPDGTEVPPNPTAAPWLAAMADVVRQMAAEADDALDRGNVIAFSDMFQEPPVDKAQLIAAFKALPPEEQAAALAELGAPPAATPPAATMSDPAAKPDGDDKAPAWFSAFEKRYADDCAATDKRLGGLEAAKTAQMSADAEEKEKQFSAEVARVVDAAVKAGHVQPWQKAAFVTHGKSLDRTKVFSDGPAKGRTEFAAWAEALTAGNVKAFSDQVQDSKPARAASPLLQQMLRPGGLVAREYPQTARELRKAATA